MSKCWKCKKEAGHLDWCPHCGRRHRPPEPEWVFDDDCVEHNERSIDCRLREAYNMTREHHTRRTL